MMPRQLISILCPSRGRPKNIARLYNSLEETTEGEWELLVRLDEDDPTWINLDQPPQQLNVIAPRRIMSELWNDLVPYAYGDILMLCGDDITFETPGWDIQVRDAFPDDGIAVVHGNDLSPNSEKIGTHPFVTRKWIDTLGYLAAPYFTSDYVDLWLCEVADALGRRVYLPDVITEHHHPSFGKAEWDQTYQERIDRADDMEQVWADTASKRLEDAEKLRMLM